MLLFWVCWASLYTPTPSRGHAESKSGYFSTRCYRNPPSPLPQFSQPPQLGRTPYWDRYVTVMPALFKCKQSKAPAHTILHTTTLLAREAFGTSSTPPLSCFPLQELMSLSPCSILYRLTGRISVCMIFIFQLFVVLGHLPSFSSKPPLLLLPFVIDQQLFPASPPWKRTRTACQMLGKNLVGVNWKQIHPEYVPWWGDNKSWWWHIWWGKKAKLCYASSMLWSILGRAKLVFFDILEVFAWITITLKGIIWNQCSATRSPC